MCPCSGLNIDSNDVTDSPEVKHGSARDFIKFVLVEGRGSHFWNGRIFVKNSSFLVVIPLVFSPFCCQYLLYLPRVFFCECCSLFSHLYMFFPTEWTLSILSWIIYFVEFVFFHSLRLLSLMSAISFQVNNYQFFLSDKFVLFYLFASFLPGFLLNAFMSQTKDFCGHFKALWDNHPSCANCFHCSRQNTC